MTTTKLTAKTLPKNLRTIDGYQGRTWCAEVCTEVTIPSDAGLWSGGSRDQYFYLRLSDGATVMASSAAAPWSMERVDNTVRLAPGYAVVEHTIFCGKDLGLRFYVHPDDVARLLPQNTTKG